MNMSPLQLHLVICSIASYTFLEGRSVRGIVGRNASISFTFNNRNRDFIHIHHNNSTFVIVSPKTNEDIHIKVPGRVRVVLVNKTDSNTTDLTINILNVTKNDSGMYSMMLRLNLTKIVDRVQLVIIDDVMIPKIEMVLNHSLDSTMVLKCNVSTSTGTILWSLNGTLIENHKRYLHKNTSLYIRNLTVDDNNSVYTCKEPGSELESDPYIIQSSTKLFKTYAFMTKEETGMTYRYMTTEIVPYIVGKDTSNSSKEVPTEKYLYFIIFGIGGIFAAAFLFFLWKKIKICFRRVRRSKVNVLNSNEFETDGVQDVEQTGKYWTIVSNAKGEMSTVVESHVCQQGETLWIAPNNNPNRSEYEDSIKSDDIYVSQGLVGYFSPISTSIVEFDDYIHPVQSNPMSVFLSKETSDSLTCNLKRNI